MSTIPRRHRNPDEPAAPPAASGPPDPPAASGTPADAAGNTPAAPAPGAPEGAEAVALGWNRAERLKVLANVATMSLLAFIILVSVNWYASRHWMRKDLTFDAQFTLSDKSKAVLDELARKQTTVKVIALWHPQTPAHGVVIPMVKDLLEEYRAYSRRIEVEQFDVVSQGKDAYAALLQLGVEKAEANDLVLVHGDVKKVLPLDDLYQPEMGSAWNQQEPRIRSFDAEQALTSAMVSVTATQKVTVYWGVGHNEVDPFGVDERAGSVLKSEILEKRENYKVNVIQIPEAKAIPDDCDLLILVGPQRKYAPEELDVLRRYLRRGGHLFVAFYPLLSEERRSGLEDLLYEYGVEVRDDVILDPSAQSQVFIQGPQGIEKFPVDPTSARSYGAHPITAKMNETNPTHFAGARSIESAANRPRDVMATPLVQSTRSAWGEKDFRAAMKGEKDLAFDEGRDLKGPLNFAMAVSRRVGEAKEGERVPETRIVVFGDASLTTNFYLQKLGKMDLLLNSLRWLAEQEHMISIEGRKPLDRKLDDLDESDMIGIQVTVMGLLPLMALTVGFWVWWARRK